MSNDPSKDQKVEFLIPDAQTWIFYLYEVTTEAIEEVPPTGNGAPVLTKLLKTTQVFRSATKNELHW